MNYKKTDKRLRSLMKRYQDVPEDQWPTKVWQELSCINATMILDANRQNERLITLLERANDRIDYLQDQAETLAGICNELREELSQCNLELLYAARRIYSIN